MNVLCSVCVVLSVVLVLLLVRLFWYVVDSLIYMCLVLVSDSR